MATRVLLTIDTELTWRHFARGAGWRDNLALSCEPAGVGLAYQLDLLRRHGLKACFFVDPMPALVYGIEPISAMVAPILAAGQEVQLHLHSFWHDLARGRRDDARFELTDFNALEQRALIETARDLLTAAGAPSPTAFRSGSYAANADTLAALRQLGLAYDSSHNGTEHPWPSALPLDPALIDPVLCGGVAEIPVTQIRRGDDGLRPFQICALSSQEMAAALAHAVRYRHKATTIVSHSFELATRDGKRVNQLVRGRFDRLCALLAANRATMPTARFADLDLAAPANAARPLPARPLRTAWRMAEQAWGTAFYEKPVMGGALISAPPLAALGGELASFASLDTFLPLRIGARTLFTLRRRLVRRRLSLEEALGGGAPALPALGEEAHGYLVTALPTAAAAALTQRHGGLTPFVRQYYRRSYARLDLDFDAYLGGFSGKSRSTCRRKLRKLAERSGGTLDVRCHRSEEEIALFHAQARAVSATTYQERLLDAGLPAGEDALAGMRALARAGRARGWLLFLDGAPIAYLWAPAEGATLVYAHLGYDPAFAEHSPGIVLQLEAMRQLMDEKAFRLFDFTEGEGQHKSLFATGGIDCVDLLLVRPTAGNLLAGYALTGFDRGVALAKAAVAALGLAGAARRLRR